MLVINRYENMDWNLSPDSPPDFGSAVAGHVRNVCKEAFPDLLAFIPSNAGFRFAIYYGENQIVGWVELGSQYSMCIGEGYTNKNEELPKEIQELLDSLPSSESHIWTPQQLRDLFPKSAFTRDRFSYAGPYLSPYADWPDLRNHINAWLQYEILPPILRENEQRVRRVIKPSVVVPAAAVLKSIYPIECEEDIKQGTAFAIENNRLVTCAHVIGTASKALKADYVGPRFPVTVLRKNDTVDLAVLEANDLELQHQLKLGSADQLQIGDSLLLAGFPNYRVGDSGVVAPGLVVGFRIVSGIRRILTNIPIVAGASGSPILHGDRVIGVAVTGSRTIQEAPQTEDHGIIPIEALNYLS